MDNLTAVATPHGLDVLKSTLKNTATKYALIGADTHDSATTGTFYTANIETSFFDQHGVLAFVVELPIETDFNKYLYAINILDTNDQIVVNTPTPKIALARGIGGMVTIKAAVTGEAGEVIFKASNYVTQTELNDKWLPPIVAASQAADSVLQNNINSLGQSIQSTKETIEAKLVSMTQTELNHINSLTTSINIIDQTKATHFRANQPFPSSNIGPIWHELYNSWMTWQVFNQNGANFEGYASVDVGLFRLGTQSTARTGWVKTGITNLTKITYAALWNWAKHNNLVVPIAQWTAGTYRFKDNGNGTFALPDLRSDFLRVFDDNKGADSGRVLGSHQGDAIRNIRGYLAVPALSYVSSGAFKDGGGSFYFTGTSPGPIYKGVTFNASGVVPTSTENRPINTSLLGEIKF